MDIDIAQVKELRDRTGVSVVECKKALESAGGDMDKALVLLSERAVATAHKKSDRALGAGVVSSYIHNNGQVGSMVLLSCETDFVSKNEEFGELARAIAMHVAAMRPEHKEELLSQTFIRDEKKTISELIAEAVQKFGERVELEQYTVFSVH